MKRPPVHHVRRDPLPKATPCHVTLRVRLGARRGRKAARQAKPRLDPASSAGWFDGRKGRVPRWSDAVVARPRYWLLTTGWRRWGHIDPSEVPG